MMMIWLSYLKAKVVEMVFWEWTSYLSQRAQPTCVPGGGQACGPSEKPGL